jgi:WD40 repeat protein
MSPKIILLNNETFASSYRGMIKIWSIANDIKCIKSFEAHSSANKICLELLGNDYFVTTSGHGKCFKIWNAKAPYDCVKVYQESSKITNFVVIKDMKILTFSNATKVKINFWTHVSTPTY